MKGVEISRIGIHQVGPPEIGVLEEESTAQDSIGNDFGTDFVNDTGFCSHCI
jgi:hypothetical protein